ncbi:hypothetical protein GGX14DRAFT_556124 [Mycena pura]|uniref:DUF7721 domain-containing protein n=1 Tax=Mycena pura TaxID=153505 RepID=A0AAD6YNW5_9AGAR|nr:hypothetical protein GGX14DRAFT_556124 [Mycena pura]
MVIPESLSSSPQCSLTLGQPPRHRPAVHGSVPSTPCLLRDNSSDSAASQETNLAHDDPEAAVSKAAQENPEDEEYYRNASQHVANHPEQHRPPTDDEAEDAKAAHHQIYKKGNTDLESMGADAVGGAIATQAIQKFLGSGGGDTNDLLAFAMKEGTQLLGGNADPGFKGVVMQKAAMMVFKSQLSGGGGGGAMSLLQKFL